MSFEERNSLSGLATSLIAWAVMGGSLWQKFQIGAFDGPDGAKLWAQSMLWLILIGIGLGIALSVLFAIIDGIIHGKDAANTQTDERDHLIALLGNRIVLVTVSIGIVGAIIAMALGWSAVAGLTLIVASCAIGDTIGTGYKVYRYRRGF